MGKTSRTALSAVVATALTLTGTPFGLGTAASVPWDPFFAAVTQVAEIDGAITNDRPWGMAAGEFDASPGVDLVVGRFDGAVYFVHGNNNGTFAAPTRFTTWKTAFSNAYSMAAGDINGDGRLDVVWGTTADQAGAVLDGEVRVWYGNGDGTFVVTPVVLSGVTYNVGTLLGDIGADATAISVGDVDGDGDRDIVAGGINGANAVVSLLRNDGVTPLTLSTFVSSTAGAAGTGSPIYWPPGTTTAVNSPWGVALGDTDGDGDLDLFLGDRALYVYLFRNNGTGTFTLKGSNSEVSGRPNVYLGHDAYRPATGYTPSLAAGDVNGDGKADLALGLLLSTHTPATSPAPAHDGEVVLDVSTSTGHTLYGAIGDVGTIARGLAMADVNSDGARDIVSGEYTGKIQLFRQLPPVDTDGDGVSDYVDNAPGIANAARIEMNTDGALTYLDQLDNDFDTVLGDPENSVTWERKGDVADPDDDNDGVMDAADNCSFTANSDQTDVDSDSRGDACDPLDNRDPDGDGVPNGYLPGSPLYEAAKAAAAKWSTGDTHFVIRIDALGRFFQDEFTRIMTDAATLSPSDWAAKCWQDYEPGDISGNATYEPCGTGEGTVDQTLTLPGGKDVPVTVVVIPKQLWSDPPVVTWINDRNNSANLEIGQHGSYHDNNTLAGSWATDPQLNFYSCESCGLTEAESHQRFKVGKDTLLGNYTNPWIAQSGATGSSPKIDWLTSANPLISYAPPFNASDTLSREAVAELGYKAFSASVFEEQSTKFTPEGSHQDAFDQFGMFHASADIELDPPDTTGDTYDAAAYNTYLQSQTEAGGLTTWLIEEVEWSGRPCQNDDRLGTCNGGTNRENNTVYLPRWNGWMQLLDYVNNYPGGVAMTMGEVALAKAFDNAPSVANPDQGDEDHDGIGDVIDGALFVGAQALTRNQAGTLSATLTNADGAGMAGETVEFSFDADGNAVDEVYSDTTDGSGVASVSVTATRPVGIAWVDASWTGELGAGSSGQATVAVGDTTSIALSGSNPSAGQATDPVSVTGTITDSDGNPLPGKSVVFTIGAASASGVANIYGVASASITLGAAGNSQLVGSFAGDEVYAATTSAPQTFDISLEETALVLNAGAAGSRVSDGVTVSAVLTEDGGPVVGRTVVFSIGTASAAGVTDTAGTASAVVAPEGPVGSQTRSATFDGDATYSSSSDSNAFDVTSEPTQIAPDATNPVSAAATSTVNVGATLLDDEGDPVAGQSLMFSIGGASASATTGSTGHASASVQLVDVIGNYTLSIDFAGGSGFDPATQWTGPFSILAAPSTLTLDATNPVNGAIATVATFGVTLTDDADAPIAGQAVTFTVGTASNWGLTDSAGHVSVGITLEGPSGPATLAVSYAGSSTYASSQTSAPFAVAAEATIMTLDPGNPTSGQYTDSVTVGATLTDSAAVPLDGMTVRFTIDGFFADAVTDVNGHASTSMTLTAAPASYSLVASFAGAGDFAGSSASHAFTIAKESTAILLPSVSDPAGAATVEATLLDPDSGSGVAGKTVRLHVAIVKKQTTSWKLVGSATTNSAGVATIVVNSRDVPTSATMKATYGGDKFFLPSEATATLSR